MEPPGVTPDATVDVRSGEATPRTQGSDRPARAAEGATVPVEEGEWRNANGGPANTRARASAISEETVGSLVEAWSAPISGSGPYGAAAGAPVVADGVVYLQDLSSNVTAHDLATGEVLWRYEVGIPLSGPNGPAVDQGLVLVSVGDSGLEALDAATGEVVWSREIEKDGFQPVIHGDLVLVGTGALAHVAGHSGFAHAFDLHTGEPAWSFQVIEEGFWGNPEVNSGGGVWYPPAIDEERGLAYFGTGNAGPYPGTVEYPNASSRPGPNLYTSSLLALDLESGELAWYEQVRERGLFDLDFQSSPILATRTGEDGEEQAVALGSGKLGEVVAFDLETHEVVWSTPVGVHQNDDLDEIPPGEEVEVYPGVFGGVETPLAASGGLVFVPVTNLPTTHAADGHGALDGSSALLNATERTPFAEGRGELVAVDIQTGAVAWSTPLDSMVFGGATVVGDLVFTATFAGVITAHRVHDGVEVWRYEAGGGINAWPAVQDDTILWPVGMGPNPRLIAFRLAEGAG